MTMGPGSRLTPTFIIEPKNVGYDVPVKWVLLNDEDTSKSLLEIVDGEVIYDVAKDGKQNECSDMQYHTISTIKRTYWGRGNKDGF